MNVKLIFILIVGSIILFGVVGLSVKFFTQFSGEEEPADDGYVFPGEDVGVPDGSMFVPTLTGDVAIVKDLRIQNGAEDIGDNNYIVGDTSSSPLYELVIYDDRSYLISLNALPLAEARLRGERDLLGRLGISKEVACTLRVRVATSFDVSAAYAGKELGLSFCPGSLTLE